MKQLVAIMLAVALFVGAAAAETWTVVVIDFDFASGEVVLEDEDGYQWTCPFGEHSWTLGEEYRLVLEDGRAEILE